MLAFTPFSSDATPAALGLGHELLIQTENSCGTFCLGSSNAHLDVLMNAAISQAQIPQPKARIDQSIQLTPVRITTLDASWRPRDAFGIAAGYRSTQRSTQRSSGEKTIKELEASSRDIPISIMTRLSESFSIAGRGIIRSIELQQKNAAGTTGRNETYKASPHRWSVDGLWQKSEATAIAVSYVAPTNSTMTSDGASKEAKTKFPAPKWTDPQEFTLSMAHFSSFRPPDGVTFGPFENVFHASLSALTWETGRPVVYAALASTAATKDGWNLTDNSDQIRDFVFNVLDPSMSVSAGLESTWMRIPLGSVSTMTHVRLNHVAAQREATTVQGGFGVSFSNQSFSLQASSLWRDDDAGYALGLSYSL
jgi:hypothetical protein